jgi:hypothetical protein
VAQITKDLFLEELRYRVDICRVLREAHLSARNVCKKLGDIAYSLSSYCHVYE